jgi:5'-3' exonuclease
MEISTGASNLIVANSLDKNSKMKENLINDKDQAFLSKELATIKLDAPVEISIDELVYNGKDLDFFSSSIFS